MRTKLWPLQILRAWWGWPYFCKWATSQTQNLGRSRGLQQKLNMEVIEYWSLGIGYLGIFKQLKNTQFFMVIFISKLCKNSSDLWTPFTLWCRM